MVVRATGKMPHANSTVGDVMLSQYECFLKCYEVGFSQGIEDEAEASCRLRRVRPLAINCRPRAVFSVANCGHLAFIRRWMKTTGNGTSQCSTEALLMVMSRESHLLNCRAADDGPM